MVTGVVLAQASPSSDESVTSVTGVAGGTAVNVPPVGGGPVPVDSSSGSGIGAAQPRSAASTNRPSSNVMVTCPAAKVISADTPPSMPVHVQPAADCVSVQVPLSGE